MTTCPPNPAQGATISATISATIAATIGAGTAINAGLAASRSAKSRPKTALIIGAGHNGLTCAFYLAKAGIKVRV